MLDSGADVGVKDVVWKVFLLNEICILYWDKISLALNIWLVSWHVLLIVVIVIVIVIHVGHVRDCKVSLNIVFL